MALGHAPLLLLVLACVACVTCSFEEANFDPGGDAMLGEGLQGGKGRRGGGSEGELSASGSFVMSNRAGNSEENALLGESQETCQGERTARQENAELKRTVAQLKKENVGLHQKLGATEGGSEQLLLLGESEESRRRGGELVTAAQATEAAKVAVKVATAKTAAQASANTATSANTACWETCKTCVDTPPGNSKGNSCLLCKDPSNKWPDYRKTVTHNGREVNVGTCGTWDGKCAKDRKGKYQCAKGMCLGERESTCLACNADTELFATRFFKDSNDRNVPIGRCYIGPDNNQRSHIPKLTDFNPKVGVLCEGASHGSCYDGVAGSQVGQNVDYKDTKKIVCTRSCLYGGKYTMQQNLKHHAKMDKTRVSSYKKGKEGGQFSSYGGYTSPVCAFHKISMCEKLETFDEKKCADGKAKHCAREKCEVRKKVSCVAILPDYSSKRALDEGWHNKLNPGVRDAKKKLRDAQDKEAAEKTKAQTKGKAEKKKKKTKKKALPPKSKAEKVPWKAEEAKLQAAIDAAVAQANRNLKPHRDECKRAIDACAMIGLYL